jgi:hypothetical protein
MHLPSTKGLPMPTIVSALPAKTALPTSALKQEMEMLRLVLHLNFIK